MATTTRVLDANVNGTVYTSNVNNALEALDTCHSGATAPTNEVANGKLWLDTSTTPGILKIYNNATWEVVVNNTNVKASGALMDSELTNIASVKALDQGVATTDSPTFADVTASSLVVNGNNYPSAGALSNRNMIINGAMQVVQRVTSFGPTATSQYTADRWYLATSSETCTVTRGVFAAGQTSVPQARKYLRLAVTTTGNFAALTQRIEDVELLGGQTVTLSFYARGGQGGQGIPTTFRTYLNQNFGSGGSGTVQFLGSKNHQLTSSWQRFTATINLPSVAGKTIGGSSYTEVIFQQTTGEACDFDIALVQLELGDTATPFEHRNDGDELIRCQRYYEKVDGEFRFDGALASGTTTTVGQTWFFTTPKRAAPSVSVDQEASTNANPILGVSVKSNSGVVALWDWTNVTSIVVRTKAAVIIADAEL